jgi:copper(I)-binding protein
LTVTGGTALAAGLSIEHPWMRFIIKARPAAGYFVLHNGTNAPVELTGAASPACGSLMLHQTKEVNGVAKMLPVGSLKVPPGGEITFQPGSYHLMCMEPSAAIAAGKSVPVTLKFSGGQSLTARFPVKGADEMRK